MSNLYLIQRQKNHGLEAHRYGTIFARTQKTIPMTILEYVESVLNDLEMDLKLQLFSAATAFIPPVSKSGSKSKTHAHCVKHLSYRIQNNFCFRLSILCYRGTECTGRVPLGT